MIFAWNGREHQFIADCLGASRINQHSALNEAAAPRTWDRIILPPDLLEPADGRYVVKIAAPAEDICHLDAVRLVAYDVPFGWSMTLDERMGGSDPQPTGQPRFYRRFHRVMYAFNERGEDVTESVQEADHVAAPIGELDARVPGRLANAHALTLHFAEPLDPRLGEPMLIIDGWSVYAGAQSSAAAQEGVASSGEPKLEALGDDGQWHVVYERVGRPAGTSRRISLPLTNLPQQTSVLRLTTSQAIYWDRINVGYAVPEPELLVRREVKLHEAELVRSGLPRPVIGSQHRLSFIDGSRESIDDSRRLREGCTAVGPMTELVMHADDAAAIFSAGDEVRLAFTADLPAVPVIPYDDENPYNEGVGPMTRVFVLEIDGWCKAVEP